MTSVTLSISARTTTHLSIKWRSIGPRITLQDLKENHEKRVRQAMEDAFADVAFPELQNAVSWVASQAPAANGSFDLISPSEKIAKNALSNGSRHTIAAGLTARATVSDYVEAEAQLDPRFPRAAEGGLPCRILLAGERRGIRATSCSN